ncbi:hypothetical protein [Reyranella soli]|jgi:hypothetical protein|uniref:Uncharacterized protein n=1 Tax=Reyranella soli TaxID=1230389 RepID=A0A512NHJ9_9HYPH|nr:hypothetical protein [Reyranella soli]GEP58385.1 hypothetical protein RSO01_55510 [Reyranella soli]
MKIDKKARDKSSLRDDETAVELHNRLAKRIVSMIVHEQVAAGGTVSDIMFLCESVLVGVVLGCFQLGSDERALDAIVSRVKERLAKVRLEDLEIKGKA